MKLKIKNILFALFSSITLLLDWKMLYTKGISSIINYQLILIVIFAFILYKVINLFNIEKNKYNKILSLFFSVFILIGNSYINYGTIKAIYKLEMIVWTIIKYIGFYNLISFIISLIQKYFNKWYLKKDIKNNRLVKLFNKHPLLFCIITIALSWSIYYVAFYPIILSPDPSFQIKQFLGERTKYLDYSININDNVTITNHHPVFHTLLIGGATKLGVMMNNVNLGLFIYSLVQGLFMAFTLSKTICVLKEKKIKNKYLFIMLGIYSLVPMFPLYAINGNKDVYYSMFILWLLMLLFKYIDSKEEKLKLKECLSWFIVLLFICLFRNNGIYVVIILLPFIIFYKKINLKRMLVTFLSVILLFSSYQNILLPSLGITKGSVRESLSIFFQQTSRYVINHEDELSSKDKKIIGTIIDYDNIKKGYKPEISDPIKNTFNKYATSKDLTSYFKVWFKGLVKHPITYVDATLNNIYGYFDPEDINWYIYTNYDTRITNLVDYHYNNLDSLRVVLSCWGNSFRYIPIIGFVSNIGFSTWIILAMGLWLYLNNLKKYIIVLIPTYVSLLVCMASPVNTYFRYAMPYVFAIPFIVGIWFYTNKKRISK